MATRLADDALQRSSTVVPLPVAILRRLDFKPKVTIDGLSRTAFIGPPLSECQNDSTTIDVAATVESCPKFLWKNGHSKHVEDDDSVYAIKNVKNGLSGLAARAFDAALKTNTRPGYQYPHLESETTLIDEPLEKSAGITENVSFDVNDTIVPAKLTTDPTARQLAYKEDYEAEAHAFLASPSLEGLSQLCKTLSRVTPENVDVELASAVIQLLEPYLDAGCDEPQSVLIACECIVWFQLAQPRAAWVNNVDISERAATAFRDVALVPQLSSTVTFLLGNVALLWARLASAGRLPVHNSFPLLTAALRWVFARPLELQNKKTCRAFCEFVVSAYGSLSLDRGRPELLLDVLMHLLRSTTAQTQFGTQILLNIVAVSGQIPPSKWSEAVDLRDRKIIEQAARTAHEQALFVSSEMSRRMIETAYAAPRAAPVRSQVRSLIEQVAAALLDPHQPAAEVFLSCFVATLFRLSTVHRERAYPTFMLDILRTLHDALAEISTTKDTYDSAEGAAAAALGELQHLVKGGHMRAASYLASRQMTLPNQSFHDLQLILAAGDSTPPPRFSAGSQWRQVLSQWPVAHYYRQIAGILLDAASRDDIPDGHQVEVLRVLGQCIQRDPQLFPDQVITKLRRGSAGVCDAVVALVQTVLQAEGPSDRNLSRLDWACCRLGAPGATAYKKRCFALLVEFAPTHQMTWRHLMQATGVETDRGVKEAASASLHRIFERTPDDALCKALCDAWNSSNRTLLKSGLKIVFSKADHRRVQRLVHRLFTSSWSAAAAIIETNGAFMPAAQVSKVFAKSVDPATPVSDRVSGLTMLRAALTSVPRLVLGPRNVASMLTILGQRTRTYSEAEFEPGAVVLWALASQGNAADATRRQEALVNMAEAALAQLLKRSCPPETPEQAVLTGQLALLAGCVRFWSQGTSDDEHRAKAVVAATAKLCRACDRSQPLRYVLLRTLFRVCAMYANLFALKPVEDLFHEVTRDTSSRDWENFVGLLIEFLSAQGPSVHSEDTKSRLFGGPDATEHAASVLLHRYLGDVLERAAASVEDAAAVKATRLISRAVADNRIDVDRCLPTIIALTAARTPDISQLARAAFTTLCERWPAHVAQRIPDGLVMCSQRSGGEGGAVVASLWVTMQEHCTSLKSVIQRLVVALRTTEGLELTRLVVDGLSRAPLTGRDARTLVTGLEDLGYTCDPDTAPTGELARMSLYLLFAVWLRHHYESGREGRATTYLDSGQVLQRFSESHSVAQNAFNTLLDLPSDAWESPDVEELLGSKAKRRKIVKFAGSESDNDYLKS